MTAAGGMAQSEPCWVPLQASAHVLQNLLLWWNFSATLRGCAFFWPADVAMHNISRNLSMQLHFPSTESISTLALPQPRCGPQDTAVQFPLTTPDAQPRRSVRDQRDVTAGLCVRGGLWYTRNAATSPESSALGARVMCRASNIEPIPAGCPYAVSGGLAVCTIPSLLTAVKAGIAAAVIDLASLWNRGTFFSTSEFHADQNHENPRIPG